MLIIADTPRLIIRTWFSEDLKGYGELLGEKMSDSKISALEPSCRAETELWRYQTEFDSWGWSRWAVVSKESGKLIGYCGFSPYGHDVEMSWRFLPSYRGERLVLEAAEAVAKYGFEQIGFDRIISFTKPDNDFAQSVMQQLGMSLERFEGWSNCTVARYSIASPA